MRGLAGIAERYGSGEVRTGHMQNLLLPDVPDENLDLVLPGLKALGFAWEGHPVRRGAIACTGIEFCNLAITETKARMIDIVTHLEDRVPVDRNLKINMNGCPNSCAQHHVGDIGLQGCKARVEGQKEQVEAYDIHLGGAIGRSRSFTRAIHRKVPADKVKFALENLLREAHKRDGEEFSDFVRRYSDEELDRFLGVETIIGAPETRAAQDTSGSRRGINRGAEKRAGAGLPAGRPGALLKAAPAYRCPAVCPAVPDATCRSRRPPPGSVPGPAAFGPGPGRRGEGGSPAPVRPRDPACMPPGRRSAAPATRAYPPAAPSSPPSEGSPGGGAAPHAHRGRAAGPRAPRSPAAP